MTTIQWINFIIDLICDLRFRLLFALAVGVIAALFGLLKSNRAGSFAGFGGMILSFLLLEGANYLLNVPLGPPLALPGDYTKFWICVGAAVLLAVISIMMPVYVLLGMILKELRHFPKILS